MAGDITYKYITDTGLPPLDGRPPNLVRVRQEHMPSETPPMATRGWSRPSRRNSRHVRPPTPYCPVEPPPPYRSMPGSPGEQQFPEHPVEGSYFRGEPCHCPPAGPENDPKYRSHPDHPVHHHPFFQASSSSQNAPDSSPARSLPVGAMIPGTRTPLIVPFNPSGESDPREASNLGYLFPPDHTLIHLIEPEYAPFSPGRRGERGMFNFEKYLAPTSMRIEEFMEQILHCGDVRRKDLGERGMVECIERPEGGWERGLEFWIGGSRGDDRIMKLNVRNWTLADIGWDASRGKPGGKAPVWIARTAA